MTSADEYSYLWDGSAPSWCLIEPGPNQLSSEPQYVIYDEETKTALVIEDDDLYSSVIEKMLSAGCKIVRIGGLDL